MIRCTGIAAVWCPIHGDCSCPCREDEMDDEECPLHSRESSHPDAKVLEESDFPEEDSEMVGW